MHEACTTTENPEDMASVIIGYEINLAAYFKTPFDKSFRERERDQMFRGLEERMVEKKGAKRKWLAVKDRKVCDWDF